MGTDALENMTYGDIEVDTSKFHANLELTKYSDSIAICS